MKKMTVILYASISIIYDSSPTGEATLSINHLYNTSEIVDSNQQIDGD